MDFPAFVESRGRHLFKTAFLLTGGDAHLAEDLVQEVLGRIYVKWRKVSRLENPAGYAQTALVNTFLSYRRRRSSTERVTDRFPEVAVIEPDPALRVTLLRALALREAADLAPDPGTRTLAIGAAERGRRRQRRRRGAIASSVAALVLVGGAGAMLTGRLPGGGAAGAAAGGTTGAKVTGQEMADMFSALLPPGTVSDKEGFGPGQMGNNAFRAMAHLVFDDGHGAAMMQLTAERLQPPVTESTNGTQCLDPFGTPTESCERTVRPDGSVLVVDKLLAREAGRASQWFAILTTSQGWQIRVDEFNATSGGPPLTRTEPPLTAEPLASVVTSESWGRLLVRMPAPKPASAPPAEPDPTPADILAKVVTMLPAGVKTGDQGGQQGRGQAHLPVTVDGRTSMVSVTVSLPSEMNRSAKKNFDVGPEAASNEHLPDGTLVITRQGGATKSGGGPAVSWSVEAFHPDGTRLTVSEWNGENGYTFHPGTPALTIDQLKAIALNPAWRP